MSVHPNPSAAVHYPTESVVRRGGVTRRRAAQGQGAEKDADGDTQHCELRTEGAIGCHQGNRDRGDEVPRIQLHSRVSDGKARGAFIEAQRGIQTSS